MEKKYLTLIDGSGYIFRAYFAIKRLEGVNAIFGFCSMLLKVLEEKVNHNDTGHIENEKIIIVFDAARKNWRNEVYDQYKANRTDSPDDLKPQFKPIKECAEAFGLPTIEMEGYEADDIIATYAEQAKNNGYITRIISSDKDLMQLVEDNSVYMYDSMKDKKVDEAAVFEKFGVSPKQVPDAQALIGDSSDNIPGVPNIGPKKAAKLIQEFGSIENMISNIEGIDNAKTKETVKDNIDNAEVSKKLATLIRDIDLETHINDVPHAVINATGLKKIIETFNFRELERRFENTIKKFQDTYGNEGFDNKDVELNVPEEITIFKKEKPQQGDLF
jgi:DNA polymerase-1